MHKASDNRRYKTLHGMRANLFKRSDAAKRVFVAWRDNAGWYWTGPSLPEGWDNPYWETFLDSVNGLWTVRGVYGAGAESECDGEPSADSLPPFERRVFA